MNGVNSDGMKSRFSNFFDLSRLVEVHSVWELREMINEICLPQCEPVIVIIIYTYYSYIFILNSEVD